MNSVEIDRVFGRGRLKMATGAHVEVFREAVGTAERRRYTKRFLATEDADFREWTQREWRMLARLIGHGIRCVPDVVQFDGGAAGGMRQVQTYDAGVTVDQWATLLPVLREGAVRRHVFEDCAHWFALAHHCLAALDEIHALQLVHLDVKADNICIPCDPPGFDPDDPDARLEVAYARLALIDFAFSLVSRERLVSPLPIGWQKDYDYQSPRLLRALEAGRGGDLRPTEELDWRCDLYSLAAMLRRYLPDDAWARSAGVAAGWTSQRYDDARTLVYRLRDCHDRDLPRVRPHATLMATTAAQLAAPDLARSLVDGWTLARDARVAHVGTLVTPLTRIAIATHAATALTPLPLPVRTVTTIVVPPAVVRNPRARPVPVVRSIEEPVVRRLPQRTAPFALAAAAFVGAVTLFAPPFVGDPLHPLIDHASDAFGGLRSTFARDDAPVQSRALPPAPAAPEVAPPPRHAPKPAEDATRVVAAPAAIPPAAPKVAIAPPAVTVPPDKTARASTPSAPAVASARSAHGPQRPDPPRVLNPMATPDKSARAQSSTTVARASAANPAAARATARLVAAALPWAPPPPVPSSGAHAIPPEVPTSATSSPADASPPQATRVEAPAAQTAVAASAAPREPATGTPAVEAAVEKPLVVSPPAHAAMREPVAPRRDGWRAALGEVIKALGAVQQRPAPVEERNTASNVAAARPQDRAAQDTPVPPNTAAPSMIAQAVPRPDAPARAPAAPVPVITAARLPAPAAAPAGPDALRDDLGVRARRLLADAVPRVAAQAGADAYRVLYAAAMASDASRDRAVIEATYVPWSSERAYPPDAGDRVRAAQLYDQSSRAFAEGRFSEALETGERALAANPRDPDIAGFLAVMHLRASPRQPEAARQLALHALAFSGARRSVRISDWSTLAIASALTDREVDASRAFLVALALSPDADSTCRAALRAYATYGEPLRVPVNTLLQRAQRRGDYAAACVPGAYRTAARSQ